MTEGTRGYGVYKSPYPYFGGKSPIAEQVWQWLGPVRRYIEPFFGSGAVYLSNPYDTPSEVANDSHGFIPNFWRAVQADPTAVAHYADWPAFECDLHARHAWLVGQKDSMQAQLEGSPTWYDAKVAGWWIWGMALWIGGEFCTGNGPWFVEDGQLVPLGNTGVGVQRRRLHLSDAGQGVKRQRVQLGDAGQGVQRNLVHLGNKGQGIHRARVHLGNKGQGIHRARVHLGNKGGHAGTGEQGLEAWMQTLAFRLRHTSVCCGDWRRICDSKATLFGAGAPAGVFLDPPYGAADRDTVYTDDSRTIASDVQAWCQRWGDHADVRIVLCGYSGEHDVLLESGWRKWTWKALGGYAQGNGQAEMNRTREACWISPHCLDDRQGKLF